MVRTSGMTADTPADIGRQSVQRPLIVVAACLLVLLILLILPLPAGILVTDPLSEPLRLANR
jgi:hypothetical protein